MRDRAWWLILVAGLALRAAAPFLMDPWEDGGEYAAMGRALAETGTLTLPFGEDRIPGGTDGEPAPSHHYPPAWPATLAVGYRLAGFGLWETKLVALAVALASILVAYACTRDLFGHRPALATAALVAVEHQLLWVQGRAYSEALLVAFFTLTLWAILRSLEDERFVLLAGLFAGLAYLTRASMGPFFLVAGAGGFAWRLWHRGWRGVANPWYASAALVFLAMVAAWALRNWAAYGSVETSAHIAAATRHGFAHPRLLAVGLAAKLALFAAFLAVYALPLHRELRRAAARWRDEATSALLLAAGLVFILGWLLTALLWTYEGYTPWFLENQRYVVVALVPLAWLALRERRDDKGLLVLAIVLLAASVATLAGPMRDPEARAVELVEPHLAEGDRVGIAWFSLYSLYPHVGDEDVRLLPVTRIATDRPEFVVSVSSDAPEGYVEVWEVHQRALTRGQHEAWVYARPDVVAARGLPTGQEVWTW